MSGELQLSAIALDAATGGELRATLVVPAAHPVLAGHFPDAPLVPGVLLLDAARQAWERATGTGCTIAAVDEVRWHAPLAPGARAALVARAAADGAGIRLAGEWQGERGRLCAFVLRLQRKQ